MTVWRREGEPFKELPITPLGVLQHGTFCNGKDNSLKSFPTLPKVLCNGCTLWEGKESILKSCLSFFEGLCSGGLFRKESSLRSCSSLPKVLCTPLRNGRRAHFHHSAMAWHQNGAMVGQFVASAFRMGIEWLFMNHETAQFITNFDLWAGLCSWVLQSFHFLSFCKIYYHRIT